MSEDPSNFDDLYETPSSSSEGSDKRRLPPGFQEELPLSLDEQAAALAKRVRVLPESLTVLKPLPQLQESKEIPEEEKKSLPCPKIYVRCLPANLGESVLHAYFSNFGEISHLVLVRDYETGVSKGYAFITFTQEESALHVLKAASHNLQSAPHMRISLALPKTNDPNKKPSTPSYPSSNKELILPNQNRLYIGPLFESISNEELSESLKPYGELKTITRHPRNVHHLPYVSVEFLEGISVRRAFGAKIHLGSNGSRLKISASQFVMEILLSQNVIFFHEAYMRCDNNAWEEHFLQFGKVYRCMQFSDTYKGSFRTYGFVDFVDSSSVERLLQRRNTLAPPGQFIRLSKYLPLHLLMNICAIGDKEATDMIGRLEYRVPESGVWGESASKLHFQQNKEEIVSSQVRIPIALVPKLMGERGKKIAEISRDSKCKVIVPKAMEGESDVVVTIKGLRINIKTAQYLMQKAIKGLS